MSNKKSVKKELQKNKLNEVKITLENNNSILQVKDVLRNLLYNSLNSSLLKLESNTENHMASLKITSKNFNDFSKIINNICKNVEESKKKKNKEKEKEKDKKSQAFKRERKMVTEINLNPRSKTIESNSNLMKFKNKVINIDGKKNISKLNKKPNIIGHQQGNRTMSSFHNINEIDKEQETITYQRSQRFKNISFQNTSQNFRKSNNRVIPATPVTKLKEREKKQILAKALNSKKIDYRNSRNNYSRTVILSHLTDIDEKSEKFENKNSSFNPKPKANNKNVKRIIYKNENKNKVIKINYKSDKNNEMKNRTGHYRNLNFNLDKSQKMKSYDETNNNSANVNLNMNSSKNIKTEETNELKSIVKLVDDVNENLNKLLKENTNQNKRRSSVKDMFIKTQSTNTLINAIKDVKIKDLQNSSIDISKYRINNVKLINLDKEDKEKNNNLKSYSLNNFRKNENNIINGNNNNKIGIFKYIYNNMKQLKIGENKKINCKKKNKSFSLQEYYINKLDINSYKNHSSSYKNIFEIMNEIKDNKKNMLIKRMKKCQINNLDNNNRENEKVQIINFIIDKIMNKVKERINSINQQKVLHNKDKI